MRTRRDPDGAGDLVLTSAGGWGVQAIVYIVFDRQYPTFGTFNRYQSLGDRLERFLSPGEPRILRLSLRRSFGRDEY